MADTTPPAPPPEPSRLHKALTAMLPQFIAYSRKGMVWFTLLSATGIAELGKHVGDMLGWTPEHILRFSNEMLLLQSFFVLIAKFWTDQIADEDKAHKAGLPPPPASQQVAGGNITTIQEAPSAPNPAAPPAEERKQ